MSQPFFGEVRMIPYNFCPRGWAYCDGQYLPISQNTALFAIIGTCYGGDGRTTMGLPNLQGRTPMHSGQAPGLSLHRLGNYGGTAGVQLRPNELPTHTHDTKAVLSLGDSGNPAGNYIGIDTTSDNFYSQKTEPDKFAPMSSNALATAGSSQPHENRQPFLTVPFCIALDGIFPPRQ